MLRADVPSMEGSAMPFGPQVLHEFAQLSLLLSVVTLIYSKALDLSYVDFEFAATRNS